MGTYLLEKYGQRPQATNPLIEKYSRPQLTEPVPSEYDAGFDVEEENPFFLKKLWDFGKFGVNVITTTESPIQGSLGDYGRALGQRFTKTAADIADYFRTKSLGEVLSDGGKLLTGGITEIAGGLKDDPAGTLNSVANGLIDFFAETPVEAVTGFKNVSGEAVPMTVEEHVAKAQEATANVINFLIQRKVTGKMLKPATGWDALKETKKMGNLGKVAMANAVGGVAGAAPAALIQNIGEEDFAYRVANNLLAQSTVGTIMGTFFDYPRYNKAIRANRLEAKQAVVDNINSLAAASHLKNSPNIPIVKALANVEGFTSADDLLEGAIRSGLHSEGFVVPEIIDPVRINDIVNKIKPSTGEPVDFTWSRRSGANYLASRLDFQSDFDRAAYFIQSGKHDDWLNDVMAATGKTRDEIYAHGKYVKSQVKQMHDAGTFHGLSQDEINVMNTQAIIEGMNTVMGVPEGAIINDYTGAPWTRQGKNFVGANGAVLPEMNQTLHQLIGITKAGDPAKGKLVIPQLPFNGNYIRDIADIRFHTSKNTGATWFGSRELDDFEKKVFDASGFIPNESVRWNNSDSFVLDVNKAGDKLHLLTPNAKGSLIKKWVDRNELVIRNPSHTMQPIKQGEGIRMAELNPEAYFTTLTKKVIDKYLEDVVTPMLDGKEMPAGGWRNFDDLYLTEANGLGVPSQVAQQLKPSMYMYLRDKLLPRLVGDESASVKAIIDEMDKVSTEQVGNKAMTFNQLVDQNGMYVHEEGGKMELRWIESNQLVKDLDSIEDGLDFLLKSGQTPLHNIDPLTGVPSDAFRLGNLATKFVVHDGKAHAFKDWFNTRPFVGGWMNPARDAFATFDNIIKRDVAKDIDVFRYTEGIQRTLEAKRVFWEAHKVAQEHFNAAVKSKIPAGSAQKIWDFWEAMTDQDIINSYLPRPLNTATEIPYAQKLAVDLAKINETTTSVVNAYALVNKVANNEGVPFQNILTQFSGSKKIVPEMHNILLDLHDKAMTLGDNVFAPDAVLKLADAYMRPSKYVDRATAIVNNRIPPETVNAAQNLEKFFRDIGKDAGIPENVWRNMFPHNLKTLKAFGRYENRGMAKEFVQEMAKTFDNISEWTTDPFSIAHIYGNAASNWQSGLTQAVRLADDAIAGDGPNSVITRLREAGKPDLAKAVLKTYTDQIDKIKGIPDLSETLARAKNDIGRRILGMEVTVGIDPTSFMAVLELAYIGFRPVMALRDFASTVGASYISFGKEFTKKAFLSGMKLKTQDITKLQLGSKIPYTTAIDLLRPEDTTFDKIATNPKFKALAEAGMKYSGQLQVYVRAMAGIHQATQEIGLDVLSKSQRGLMSKAEAYDRLGLDAHSLAVQREFDRIITTGDIQGGIDFLSKWNQKIIANDYAQGNSPVTWKRGIARVAGQMGSWGANMMQTALNGTVNKGAMKRFMRFGAFNAAVGLASYTTGLNISNWVMNPINMIPGVGPGVEAFYDMTSGLAAYTSGTLTGQEDVAEWGINRFKKQAVPFANGMSDVGKFYLPGSYQLRDILRGVEIWNDGNDPFMAAAQAVGLKPSQE